jgi:hypothetical protein
VPDVYPSQGVETRIVREQSYAVPPTIPPATFKRLGGFGIRLGDVVEIDAFAPPGALVPTTGLVNDVYAEGEVEGRLDFNGLAYVFSGLFGEPGVTSLGGAPAAYRWTWLWNGRCPNRCVSFLVHSGFANAADVGAGWVFNSLEISGGSADGFEVSGEGFAKPLAHGQALGGITIERQTITATPTVSGGTYTLTFGGATTAAIAYNATAAVVDSALEALSSIGAGGVVVAGGPLPATPMTVDFLLSPICGPGGDIPMLVVGAGALTGGGTYTVATTTPSADAVVDVPPVPAGALYGRVFLDTTWAALGTSKELTVFSETLTIGERMSRVRPINKERTSDSLIDVADQEHTLALVMARNASSDAQIAKMVAGTKVFPRLEWEGDVISGANRYLLRVDSCVLWTEIGMPDDTENVSTKEITGRLAIDAVSGNVVRIELTNTLAAL